MERTIPLIFITALVLALPRVAFADARECVFSIEVVTDGGGLHRPGDTSVGDGIFIYEVPGGDLVAERREGWHGLGSPQSPNDESWGAGKEFTSRIREAFRRAHLRDSDFRGTPLTGRQDLRTGVPLVIGARHIKVHADLEGTSFTLECEAFGSRLDFYSRSDPELAKLKTLLDQIAFEYGKTKLLLD
jgi:hypothetical protein